MSEFGIFINENPYSVLYKEFGLDSRALGWSKESQLGRFEKAFEIFNFENTKVLDIGSGFADFLIFLTSLKKNIGAYTGLEPFNPFYTESQRRIQALNESNFEVINISWEVFYSKYYYDVALALGTFNFAMRDNYIYVTNFINHMLNDKCNCLIISALSNKASKALKEANQDKFFYDPQIITNFLIENGFSYELFEDYLPHDFMIKINK